MHLRRSLLATALALGCLIGAIAGTSAQDDDFIEIPGLGTTRIDVPRPSTGDPECISALPEGETIAQRVVRLRGLGLFADRASLTDAELSAAIEARLMTWGYDITPDDPYLELVVADQDHDRVWWRDLEADVMSGEGVYAATLEEWAAISVGAFVPTGITETWAGEEGPVRVSFELDGASHVLEPEYLEDWIDPRILEPINRLIEPMGRRFRMLAPFDQSAFVMALTEAEAAGLEASGWCFT